MICCFNPRTRMGCDGATLNVAVQLKVSIHAPAWGATPNGGETNMYPDWFQSTHPHGVRPKCITIIYGTREFQSTHPHGVRHIGSSTGVVTINVSIHAPAWGATSSTRKKSPKYLVSIHAPAWGATSVTLPYWVERRGFNPRTRMGCDLVRDRNIQTPSVSIHAPAWGATPYTEVANHKRVCFNPRTRMGCDPPTPNPDDLPF